MIIPSCGNPTSHPPRNWHLFCRVVDNYGDIGICWRLARQLHHRHGCEVTLWVDDLVSFHTIESAITPAQARQRHDGIHIRHWSAELPPLTHEDIGEVVIEAFACDLPAAYLELMQLTRPLWINLEYLSAEDWVVPCHRAPSPRLGLNKFFFFPGFTTGTGGLLWEPPLLRLCQQQQPLLPLLSPSLPGLLQELGVAGPLPDVSYHISLFAYETPALKGLLDALSRIPGGVHLLVPQGRISDSLGEWLGGVLPTATTTFRGRLTLTALPFMSQMQYDRLLAACDLNFVRGEDSFVRSQMVGRPLIWHIYPQEEGTHGVKLQAFLERYTAGMDEECAAAIVAAHLEWNALTYGQPADWEGLLAQLPRWQLHALQWRSTMALLGDLTSNLVTFCTNQV